MVAFPYLEIGAVTIYIFWLLMDFICLYLSVKYAKENNKRKGKIYYNIMITIEKIENLWFYLVILFLLLEIGKYIS